MPTATAIQNALKQTGSQSSFFSTLLNQTLGWPVTDAQIEDISYSWSADDLQAAELERDLIDGVVWQIQPLEQGQPWGIFVLEFKNAKLFTASRGMASVLRKILRGLVSSRRKQAGLPSWKREHLLFICTQGWQQFRFAYFRSKPEDPRSSRLTTFGWEPGSSNRTVCEFNLPALVWPDDSTKTDKWIADWAKAFDKDRLTNDFFKRFDQALDLIKSDLQEFQKLKSDEAYTQAQLLLERLIFLYFLQNRGWLKQDRRYMPSSLQEHLKKPDVFSYYSEFLEKVFWSLSTPPQSSGDRIHGLPFLNGGLFDDDEFDPSERRKKTSPPLKVRNGTLGSVFRDLLEAFNFTVTEDTPLNQEVAVDPEMLGKVFESIVLHAEQADPDATAPDKRKATGSYYTPRIVVHFICQEVLYQYLKNHLPGDDWGLRLRALLAIDASDGIDELERESLKKIITSVQAAEALKLVTSLRCCDPAVGSGAFPVGLLHELVNLRRILQTAANGYVDPIREKGSSWLQIAKQEIVQNCLFGVDIQQQAIEICRLRLWLSLVVDYDLGLDPFKAEKSEFNRAIDGISQLPNLEMNFHRGDSLHDYISGVPIVIMPEKAGQYAEEFKEIANAGDQLHKAKRAERKKKLRVQILQKRLDLSHRILKDEINTLDRDESSLEKLFHDETESSSNKRNRIIQEKARLQDALEKIGKDRKELGRLTEHDFDSQFYVKLRKLEGADFDSPFNFAWLIDFPSIFGTDKGARGGFDIVVGNPPFVTARNPKKRELWAERWPRVCRQNYQLLCPFFDLSFGLLRPGGEIGFIVSNAFAKREFGIPLIETLFPTVNLQKVVDCSGLMFPGHGTPTCIVFGLNQKPNPSHAIRVIGILSGGGDLRTQPEESALWREIEEKHDHAGFSSARIIVSDVDRPTMDRWPWNFASEQSGSATDIESRRLSEYCSEPIGAQFITGKDEVYVQPAHYLRRIGIPREFVKLYGTGEDVRDWVIMPSQWIVFPYDAELKPLTEPLPPSLLVHLRPHKTALENSVISGSIKKKETQLKWFEFRRLARAKFAVKLNIIVPQIATHAHFVIADHTVVFKEKAQAIALNNSIEKRDLPLLTGVLNSSLVLERLKQECFSKRESAEPEKDTYYEFSGGKLEEIRLAGTLVDALSGGEHPSCTRIRELAEACWNKGKEMPSLALRKLFEKPTEAYNDWYSRLSGHLAPHPGHSPPFDTTAALRKEYQRIFSLRDEFRGKMIDLQEDIDWVVYALYGLLPLDHPAIQTGGETICLDREKRPFHLLLAAEADYTHAIAMIPASWSESRKRVWESRLAVIHENENIRRLEQPIHKRRWDEQWKVGNQWRCGPVAYAAELVDAFEWWLREKAEWWLENKKAGGPVEFDDWAKALWKDERVNAAWPVAAEEYAKLQYDKALQKTYENDEPAPPPIAPAAEFVSFRRELKRIVDEETVAENIPFAVPYEELEKKLKRKVPGNVSKVRGKLNVPRERFHLRDKTQYLWAGRQFSE